MKVTKPFFLFFMLSSIFCITPYNSPQLYASKKHAKAKQKKQNKKLERLRLKQLEQRVRNEHYESSFHGIYAILQDMSTFSCELEYRIKELEKKLEEARFEVTTIDKEEAKKGFLNLIGQYLHILSQDDSDAQALEEILE